MFDAFKKTRDLVGPKVTQLPIVVLFYIVASILDLFSIGLIWPVLLVIQSPEKVSGYISRLELESSFPGIQQTINDHVLYFVLALLLLAFYVRTIFSIYVQRYVILYSVKVQSYLMGYFSKYYLNAPYAELKANNTSDILSSVTSYTNSFIAKNLLAYLRLFGEIILVSVILCFLLITQLEATLVLTAFLGAGIATFNFFFRGKLQKNGSSHSTAYNLIVKLIQETAFGIKEIRVLGKERHFEEALHQAIDSYGKSSLAFGNLVVMPRYIIETIFITGLVAVLIIMRASHPDDPQYLMASVGTLVASGLRLLPSLSMIVNCFAQIRFAHEPTAKLHDLYRKISGTPLKVNEGGKTVPHNPFSPLSRIDFEKMTFAYSTSPGSILQNVTLSIKRGEMVGIIGSSGTGKSTFVDLLIGLLHPLSGNVAVNGDSITGRSRSWMNLVSYIPQEIFIFDDSIRNNIALGVHPTHQNEGMLNDALKAADLFDFVSTLPMGIETPVGERGNRLSGGQRQRLGIARAYYHEREVLVFDEATSALDMDSEKQIIESIAKIKGKKTVIMISHRMRSLAACDRIFQIKAGQVHELNPDAIREETFSLR